MIPQRSCRCETKVTTGQGTMVGISQILSVANALHVLILFIKYNLLDNKNGQQ